MTDPSKKYVFADPGASGKAAARAKYGDDVVLLNRTKPGAFDIVSLKTDVDATERPA